MKLLRFGPAGSEKPGMLDDQDKIRDVSAFTPDFDRQFFETDGIARLRAQPLTSFPVVDADVRLGACVAPPGNFLAIGMNYAQHAKETGSPIPSEPIMFSKAPSCVSGPNDVVVLPKGSVKCDWEVEIAMVIGRPALYVDEADALSYVAGFCICNDVSEREYQMERGSQWAKGKMFPTFGPLGPWLVTPDELADPQQLPLWLELNGERVQDSSTADMIFSLAHIVSYASRFVQLEPGDIITTGTPQGVGLGMKPQRFLRPGDTMQLSVAGLGIQRQTVVAFEDSFLSPSGKTAP